MSEVIPVSDHAVLRYLERVHGIDVEFFRRCVLLECGDHLKAGLRYAVIGDHTFIFRDGWVITVLAPGQRPHNERERRAGHRKAMQRARREDERDDDTRWS